MATCGASGCPALYQKKTPVALTAACSVCQAALVDFELPDEAVEYFPWCADDPGERWWLSMQCFNDPCSAAALARGTGITPYPLPLLLAIGIWIRL